MFVCVWIHVSNNNTSSSVRDMVYCVCVCVCEREFAYRSHLSQPAKYNQLDNAEGTLLHAGQLSARRQRFFFEISESVYTLF